MHGNSLRRFVRPRPLGRAEAARRKAPRTIRRRTLLSLRDAIRRLVSRLVLLIVSASLRTLRTAHVPMSSKGAENGINPSSKTQPGRRIVSQTHPCYPRVRGTPMRADAGQTREIAMSQVEGPFRLSSNGYFMEIRGPAWYRERRWFEQQGNCQKKLCFVATDQALLADVLGQLAERPDCYYVKYSTYQKDGMYLGRCFLMDEHEVSSSGPITRSIPACSAPFRMTTSRPRFVRLEAKRGGEFTLRSTAHVSCVAVAADHTKLAELAV